MDLRQTSEYSKYVKALGWDVQKINGSLVFIKAIPLLGKIAKLQRPLNNPSKKDLDQFIKKYNISILSMEPEEQTIHGFSYSSSPYLPSKTIQLDLRKTSLLLLSEMKQKTRYNIKIAEKNKLTIKKSVDINLFVEYWQNKAIERGQFLPQKKEIINLFQAFGKKSHLYFAYKSNNIVAGLLILDSPDTAYYMYAFTTDIGKRMFAPTLLSWNAILQAKKRKLKRFDFDGIYDERYPKTTKNWMGFTKFKEGFGGRVIEFPDTLVYYRNPILKLFNI